MSVTTTPMPPPMRAASAALDTAYAVPVFPPEAVPEQALRLSAVCAVQPFVEQAVMMVLVAVLGIRIGDEVIGRAMSRYNRRQAVMRGGAL